MPHIPRSMAPSGLMGVEAAPKAPKRSSSKAKTSVPYRGGQPSSNLQKQESNPLTGKLSMQKWDVDPLKVYQHLTDKELEVDEYSGLVSPERNAPSQGCVWDPKPS